MRTRVLVTTRKIAIHCSAVTIVKKSPKATTSATIA
jgi:hypothetical protein